jgi:ABC-type sugar transport system substrate-binding protein
VKTQRIKDLSRRENMKKIRLLALLVVIVMVFASCSSTKEQSQSGTESQKTESTETKEQVTSRTWTNSKGEFKVADRIIKKINNGEKLVFRVSIFNPVSPYADEVRLGISEALGKYDVDCKLIGPADASIEGQIAELETLIDSEQVDGLAVDSGDADTIMPVIEKAWNAGIPVLTFDLDSPNAKRLAFVGVKLEDVGEVGAQAFMKLHPQKEGKLLLLAAIPSAVYARTKFEIIEQRLKENNYNVELVGPFELGLDMAAGYSVVENAFMANPDITGVYVADEYVEVAAKYIADKNLKGKQVLLGCNTFEAILDYVKKGIIQQTTGYNPKGQGYDCVRVLYEFLMEGKTTDELLYVICDDVTTENVEAFIESIS